MFSRKPAEPPAPDPAVVTTGKGHATPKRKEAQAARQRPLVTSDRKAAKKAERARRDEAYARQQQAMITGDDRYLPLRDRGPARRFARNYVDARLSLGELFMPLAFLILLVMMLAGRYPEIAWSTTISMYVIVFGAMIDSLVMVYFLRKHLSRRFAADEIPGWTGVYAFQRSFMLRRFRMPKPQNKRGEWPHKATAA